MHANHLHRVAEDVDLCSERIACAEAVEEVEVNNVSVQAASDMRRGELVAFPLSSK